MMRGEMMQQPSHLFALMLSVALGLALALVPATQAQAEDITLVSLKAQSEHLGSKVWSGKFRGLNGRDYNASEFYQSENPEFSATALLMLQPQQAVSWLLPISVDAGYQSKLYAAAPLASIGFGAAISLNRLSVLTVRADNLLVAGGAVSERPCYDGYRRRYHCGTGLAWTDFQRQDIDRRGNLAVPGLHIHYIRRFSF